jgi:cytochrome c oxidase subunit II
MRSFNFFPSSSARALFARWSRVAFALGTAMFVAGCDLNFWRMDGPQSTINTAGPVAKNQLEIFYVTVWVTLIIFILVAGVLAYATLKFRARSEAEEHAEPPAQSHGNPLIELGLIGASVLALVIIAVPTLKGIWYTHDVPEAEKDNAYVVNAVGYQWWFRFEYPNEQIQNVGQLVTSNELVIPAGRPVHVNLRAMDVIHSFWVPRLAGKVDMIPNRANFLWMQADEPGYFWGQCAEFCGDSHAVMRFRVIALGPKEFNEWLEQQSSPARTVAATEVADANKATAQFASVRTDWKRNEPGYTEKYDLDPLNAWREKQFPNKGEDAALIAQGRKLFQQKNCITCHTIRGHEGIGTNAPDLTHIGSRTTIAAGLLENEATQLARWIMYPNEVKPGNKMYHGIGAMRGYVTVESDGKVVTNITVSPEEAPALVAYLQSLK